MKLSDFSKMKNLKTDVHTMSLNFSQHKDELISIIENDKSWEPTTDGVVYTNLFTTYRTGWHIHKNYSLVKKMCEMTNSQFSSIVNEVGERLGKDKNYLLNSDNLRNNLNWSDKISLHNGIEETMSWIDQNLDLLNTLPWDYIHKA